MERLVCAALFLAGTACLASAGEPDEALPILKYEYEPKGDFESIDDLPIYVARSANPEPGRFVVWGYDIFGWVAPSRGFEMVDNLSELTGMTVIMPDFLRGGSIPEPEDYEWATIMKFDWEEKLIPYLEGQGATAAGSVGTCWGTYFVVHSSSYPIMKVGFNAHPSHPGYHAPLNESEADIYQAIQDNGAVQYFGNTDDIGDTVRPGGLADSIIDQVFFDEFDLPCQHGFFNRGDLSDPVIKECVDRAYAQMVALFETYVK